MDTKTKYKTKQRELLLEYLESVPGVHITVSDVCQYFKDHDAAIAQATVYRQLERLVDEGLINKYIIDGNSPACFEFLGTGCHGEEVCFHCKCEKCGRLIHLHCEELEEIQTHLFREHHFKVNPMRTVFYGVCDECLART